jgi:hypothetical protein
MDAIVLRQTSLGDVSCVVRGLFGVYDCQRLDGQWVCSCGQSDCCHIARAELHLIDRDAAMRAS